MCRASSGDFNAVQEYGVEPQNVLWLRNDLLNMRVEFDLLSEDLAV